MGVYLFMIGAYDLKFRGEYNRHAQAWMDSVPCQVIGSLAMLSTEVSVLLLTYLTLEKYICIVYPIPIPDPRPQTHCYHLVVIWILGFFIAFLPLVCKGVFKNFYGTMACVSLCILSSQRLSELKSTPLWSFWVCENPLIVFKRCSIRW